MKKKIVFFILSLCILCASAHIYIVLEKNNIYKQVREEFFYGTPVDENLLNKKCEKIMKKINSNKNVNADEYFILAYNHYLNKEEVLAHEYSSLAIDNIKFSTKSISKIYSGVINVSMSENPLSTEENFDTIAEILRGLTIKDWNQNYYPIGIYMDYAVQLDKGVQLSIEVLEKLLVNEKKLNDQAKMISKSRLSLAYMSNGNYAKALEQSLELLAKAREINDKFSEAHAYVNLGKIYTILGDYNQALAMHYNSLKIEVEDDYKNSAIKAYALISIYEIASYTDDLNLMESINGIIEKYLGLEGSEELDIFYNINYANYYLKVGDLENARKYITLAKQIYDDAGPGGGMNIDIMYNTTIANYYYASDLKDEALKIFDETLSLANDSYIMKKQILKSIINIYHDNNDEAKVFEYSNKLQNVYEEESLLINEDYSNYSNGKYSYEVKMNELNNKKLVYLLIVISVIFISSWLFIIIYMRNKQLREKNKIDGLTNVYNRNYFNEFYNNKLSENKNFYLFIFDIDNFKSVNDTYGHLTGDEVLVEVSKTVKNLVDKNNGTIFRYGGEEFIVIIEEKDEKNIIELAHSVIKSIEELIWNNGMKITISMGIAGKNENLDDMLKTADERLYVSKTSGKNKFTWINHK